MRVVQFLVFWIWVSSVFFSHVSYAGVIECEADLLPPAIAQSYVLNFLSRATIDLATPVKNLAKAAELTQELLVQAGLKNIAISRREGQQTPFEFRVRYGWKDGAYHPVLEEILISPKALQSLYAQEKATIQLVAMPQAADLEMVRAWVSGLAELYGELEYEKGNLKLDDINIFSQLEVKAEWLLRFDRAHGIEAPPLPSEVQVNQYLWPKIEELHDSDNVRQVVLWLGLSQYARDMDSFGNFAKSLEQASSAQENLNQAMLIARGHVKMGLLALGERAADVYFVEKMLAASNETPLVIPRARLEKMRRKARARYEETYAQLARQLAAPKPLIVVGAKN